MFQATAPWPPSVALEITGMSDGVRQAARHVPGRTPSMAHSSSSDTSFRPYSMSIFGPPAHCGAPMDSVRHKHHSVCSQMLAETDSSQVGNGARMRHHLEQSASTSSRRGKGWWISSRARCRLGRGLTSMDVADASCMRSAQLTLGYFSLIGFSHPTARSRPAGRATAGPYEPVTLTTTRLPAAP